MFRRGRSQAKYGAGGRGGDVNERPRDAGAAIPDSRFASVLDTPTLARLGSTMPIVTVTRRLGFAETMTKISRERIADAFERSMARAMGSAR